MIDEGAARKIREYIELGRSEGKLELACEVPPGLAERVGKPFVGPHIFSGIRPEHRLANVGNLDLNRGITGAVVGRQPFDGFGLSGAGTKAGGSDYLLHFVEPRSCTENTLRHGFAPGLE